MLPSCPTTRLRRSELAAALTQAGYPMGASTLATMAARNPPEGPPFSKFGRFPIYTWSDALAWAEARLTAPRRNTAEATFEQQAA
jgi:hypothetical protein